MAYRTLAFSLFIIFFMGSFTLVNEFMEDVEAVDNTTTMLVRHELGDDGVDMRVDNVGALNGSFDSIQALEMWNQPASEQEQAGGDFTSTSMARIVWDVLINSSIGFASFMTVLLRVPVDSFPAAVLTLIQWGIILNHSFALLQILFSKLGSGGSKMTYTYTPEYYNAMTNGSLVTAVDTLLTDKTGGFWYILLFGTPIIMVWMKTGSIALPTALALWSVVLYGQLMGVDNILGLPLTIFIVLGLAAIAMKFLGPFR